MKDQIQKILSSHNPTLVVAYSESKDISLGRISLLNKSNSWNSTLSNYDALFGVNGLNKTKEWDGRSPSGIFKLGPAFGFEVQKESYKGFPYIRIDKNTICIDDKSSRFYNRIINKTSTINPDWRTCENMLNDYGLQYKIGLVIDVTGFSMPPFILQSEGQPFSASCIHLHCLVENLEGTDGCTAVEENFIDKLLTTGNINSTFLVQGTKSFVDEVLTDLEVEL